jgi:tetratricopeptide (TPR) repeat protein
MHVQEKQKSELYNKAGIFCLKVAGNPYKIGFQHGTHLKEQIENGVYKFFSNYIQQLLKNNRRTKVDPLSGLILRFLRTKSQKFINRLPKEIKDEIRGLCDATGLDYNTTLESFVFPELTSYLVSKYAGDHFALKTHLSGAALLGCTSIIAMGQATETGELYHGRNFDFLGIGYWEKYPLVSYIYPDDGFSYISVSSAGIVGGVVSGINEKQITYAVHQNYTKEYSENNLPILALGTLIMKYADNIERAKEIILASKSTSGWSVVITDNKSKEAFVAEICADQVVFRNMENDLLLCTNSYISPELHDYEIIINPLLNLSSNSRYQRVEQLTSENFHKINPEFIAHSLGDRYDITSEKERIFGYTVSQNHTISSVIFAPERNMFWVASGNTPVCNADYIPFNFDFEESKTLDSPVLEGIKFNDIDNEKAMSLVIQAHEAYELKDIQKSLSLLLEAIELLGTLEPTLHFLCGLLNLKSGKYEKAREFLQTSYDNEQDIYKSGIIKLWMGRVYDLLGNREKALRQYRYVEQMNKQVYGEIIDLARQGLKKAYKKRYIKYIKLDIWYGEEITAQ